MHPTLLLLAAGLTVTGCAADAWRAVDERLYAASADARAAGYAPLAGRHNDFGAFRDSGSTTWRLDLRGGPPLVTGAACAPACARLDLTITGPGGFSASDTSAGTTPFLAWVPPDSGSYTVTLHHGACEASRCWWAGQVYGLKD